MNDLNFDVIVLLSHMRLNLGHFGMVVVGIYGAKLPPRVLEGAYLLV